MTSEQPGWRPLSLPGHNTADDFTISPFTRLARVHATSTAGDALVAVALAGSLFFSIPTGEARGKVTLYLLLTMAPFALVAPLVGPAIDRAKGGRRLMIIASAALRLGLCALMIRDLRTNWLFPEAFLLLVFQKGYQVARAAYVPTTVRTATELVEANSKLALISGLMGFLAVGPGILASKLAGGGKGALVLAIMVLTVTIVLGFRLPKERVARYPADEAEKEELRGAGVVLAASGMALLRGIVGFLTLLLAFDFRGHGHPKWQFGVVAAFSVLGALIGSAAAPKLRALSNEETLLSGMLVFTLAAAAGAALIGGWQGASVLGCVVGISSTAGRAAFDSIVQRDAPDANRGRSFARFETRFQMSWVLGAFLPVVIKIPVVVGFIIVGAVSAFASFSYIVGSAAARNRHQEHVTAATARAAQLDERLSGMQTEVTERVSGAAKSVRRRIRRPRQPEPSPPSGPSDHSDRHG